MLQLVTKSIYIIAVCIIAVMIISCGFMDLRPISYELTPREQNTVLETSDAAISISFETKMDNGNQKIEKLINVTSLDGNVECDINWEGNTVYYRPLKGWTSGLRYTFKIDGEIEAEDGRKDTASASVSFFALSDDDPPRISECTPKDGGVLAITTERSAKLRFVFSKDMDTRSVEDSFSIEGIRDLEFKWTTKNEMVVTGKQFDVWKYYTWSLKKGAKSAEDIPTTKAYSGTFTIDIDRTLPAVKKIYPVFKNEMLLGGGYNWQSSGAYWYNSGVKNNPLLGYKQAIAIEFTKVMDNDSVSNCVSIEPSLSGTVEKFSSKTIIFILNNETEPEKEYTLKISADTKDVYGLKMTDEKQIRFKSDLEFLKITKIAFNGTEVASDDNNKSLSSMNVSANTNQSDKLFPIDFTFSQPFSIQNKTDMPTKITFTPYFPSLPAIPQIKIHWTSEMNLSCHWDNIEYGDDDIPHYYKLTIPGGQSGINNGQGSYLKESISIIVEVKKWSNP
jgi:hypothetical protein